MHSLCRKQKWWGVWQVKSAPRVKEVVRIIRSRVRNDDFISRDVDNRIFVNSYKVSTDKVMGLES